MPPQPPSDKMIDAEFKAKDLITGLRKDGFTPFQQQMIGIMITNAGSISLLDQAHMQGPSPIIKMPDLPVRPPVEQNKATPPDKSVPRKNEQPITPPANAQIVNEKTPAPPAVPPNPKGEAGGGAGEKVAPSSPPPAVGSDSPGIAPVVETCEQCFGTVSVNEKKASKLFFNKTLCASCCDKQRIKTLREKGSQLKAAKERADTAKVTLHERYTLIQNSHPERE